jgi:prevent-host-death family protein
MQVSVNYAKTNFSRLVEKAALGEEVIITKAGRPVAKLVSAGSATQPRKLGSAKGAFTFPKISMNL